MGKIQHKLWCDHLTIYPYFLQVPGEKFHRTIVSRRLVNTKHVNSTIEDITIENHPYILGNQNATSPIFCFRNSRYLTKYIIVVEIKNLLTSHALYKIGYRDQVKISINIQTIELTLKSFNTQAINILSNNEQLVYGNLNHNSNWSLQYKNHILRTESKFFMTNIPEVSVFLQKIMPFPTHTYS